MTSQRFNLQKKEFYKRNLSDAIEVLIPGQYLQADLDLSGIEVDPTNVILNNHILLARDLNTILPLSAGIFFSSINTYQGIQSFFFKQNNYTNITPESFERTVLNELGTSFRLFESSSVFKDFVTTSLIPQIQTNTRSGPLVGASGTDKLIQSLGWFYFLAGSSTDSYQPSSTVVNYFVDKLYRGKPLTIADGINALTEYLWRNQSSYSSYIPANFLSGSTTYTSGTQLLEALKTYNSVIYSTETSDIADTLVRDSFELFSQTSELNLDTKSKGPFFRLLKAFSFLFSDQRSEVNDLEILYDLEQCPDHLLEEIAKLIGWELVGYDPKKWRLQLVNAVQIYKRAGTKQSIIAAVNSVFTPDIVNISSNLRELWESYVPFLILYSLATKSIHFQDFRTYTPDKAIQLGINDYDYGNFDNNIKLAVDKIILTLFEEFPDHFQLAKSLFPVDSEDFKFDYRGRVYPIPPFEEIPYYVHCVISDALLTRLADLLVCFGVPQDFAIKVKNYIDQNTISTIDERFLDYSENNGWLFFTLDYQQPPNWEEIILDPVAKKELYLPLWNGKSSHYKLNFDANDFNFSKATYETDSQQVIQVANRLADRFAPAHAIKDSSVILRTEDEYSPADDVRPQFWLDKSDELVGQLSSITFGNVDISAIDLLGTLLEFSGVRNSRYTFSSLVITNLSSVEKIIAKRNTYRRKDYHNKLSVAGYYSRTGVNAPLFTEMLVGDPLQEFKFTQYTFAENPEALYNPIKGYYPNRDLNLAAKNSVPRSVERIWMPLSGLFYNGGETNTYDWTTLDAELDAISSVNCQAVIKFYIDHPQTFDENGPTGLLRPFALPLFLSAVAREQYEVPSGRFDQALEGDSVITQATRGVSGYLPNYADPLLVSSLQTTISAIGARYDGDPRLAMIEIGLLGHWGGWKNREARRSILPVTLTEIPIGTINAVINSFDNAFSQTQITGRFYDVLSNTFRGLPDNPTELSDIDVDVGITDNNLCYQTIPPRDIIDNTTINFTMTQAIFYNVQEKYKRVMNAAEIYPPLLDNLDIFAKTYSGPIRSPVPQKVADCIRAIRPSLISGTKVTLQTQALRDAYNNGANNDYPVKYKNIIDSIYTIGYSFYIDSSFIPDIVYNDKDVEISLTWLNLGAAPFYYNWPVIISFINGTDVVNIQTDWDLRTLIPGIHPLQYKFAASELTSVFAADTELTVRLSVQKPASFVNNLVFMNAEHESLSQYMTLGTTILRNTEYFSDTFAPSGFIPLGFIPSSLTFASVSADCSGVISEIPEVYDRCALYSSANYYGYDVSTTMKSRGYRGFQNKSADIFFFQSDSYVDRDKLDPFMAVVHKIAEQKLYKKYEKHVKDNISQYASDLKWRDVVSELVNKEITCSGLFLSSLDAYENFGLGRKVHELYHLYTSAFNRHPTAYQLEREFGASIYAHAFGSIIENSDLESKGPEARTYSTYTTDIRDVKVINSTTPYFSGTANSMSVYGTTVVTNPSAIIASSLVLPTTTELVNSGIIANTDVIFTSGSSPVNHFVFYDLQQQKADSFVYDNAFLRMKSVNGLPRIRFKIPGIDLTESYDTKRSSNFLVPENNFTLKVRALAALENGSKLINARLGVWIHTDTEGSDLTWHFGKNGRWQLLKTSDLTITKILTDLTHTHEFTTVDRTQNNRPTFQCLDSEQLFPIVDFLSGIGTFSEDEFEEFEFKFDTRNYCRIKVPEEYFKIKNQPHRLDQTYVVELFMIPEASNTERFILLDNISLVDNTIHDLTRIDVTGTPTGHKKYPLCDIYHVDLSKEDIRAIFNYYNSLGGVSHNVGGLSRDPAESTGINFDNGGSRANYRINPRNTTYSTATGANNFNLVDLSPQVLP